MITSFSSLIETKKSRMYFYIHSTFRGSDQITSFSISSCSKIVRFERIFSEGIHSSVIKRGLDPVAITMFLAVYFLFSIARVWLSINTALQFTMVSFGYFASNTSLDSSFLKASRMFRLSESAFFISSDP